MKSKFTPIEKRWILYDVGNSAFTLLCSTVLPIYFSYIAGLGGVDETQATAYWAYTASIVTIIVAVLGPVFGTFADYKGLKKPIFLTSALIGIVGCASMAIPMSWLAFVIVFIIAKVGYSSSLIFYDSMLTDVTDHSKMDDLSSQGYAWGYIGSCIPFAISIVIINFTPLDIAISMPIALCLNALWWLGMTIPLSGKYRQVNYIPREKHAVRKAFKRLFGVITEKHAGKKAILLYLLAFFLYIDGVYTIIDMATSFGTALGFDSTQLLLALLVTQVVAFPSAIIFGKMAGKFRNDRLIFVCICAYTAIALFAIQMDKVWEFWLLAVCVGMFQGGIQALSRSYFAKIIPAEKSGEYFGIMDIFGKGAAFIGTLSVGVVTDLTNNANLGVIPIAVLLIAGLVVFAFAAREVNKFQRQHHTEQVADQDDN